MDTIEQKVGAETPGYRWRWWTLAIVSATVVIATIDETILNVALPSLQTELGASASALQWIVNSYVLVFGGLLLTMGGLGDRFGRARMLRYGLAVFALSSVAAALSQSPAHLIAARVAMGVGGAMMMPATLSIIVNVFDEKEMPRAIAVWAMMAGVGVALGPLVGGLLLQKFYWGSVFLVNVPIAAIAIAASVYLVPDSRDPESRPLDLPGAVLSTASLSAIIFVIIEGSHRGFTSPEVLAAGVIFMITGVGFIWRERTARFPLLDFDLFRMPAFSTGAVAISVALFSMVGFIFGLTQYFQFVQGHSPLEAGVRFLPVALGFMVGAIASEKLAMRFGGRWIVSGGLAILTAAMPVVVLWDASSSYLLIGPLVAVIGLGAGMVVAPAAESVMGAVGHAKAAVGSAMNDVTQMLASAISVAVIGSAMYAIYADRLRSSAAFLTSDARDAVVDSIGAAMETASELPGANGETLKIAASDAFTDALGLAVLIGAGLTLAGVVVVAKFMPSGRMESHGATHGEEPAHAAHAPSAAHTVAGGD